MRLPSKSLHIYAAFLKTACFSKPRDEGPSIQYLRGLFAGRKLDMIAAIGGPAARLFEQHRARLFRATPTVIAGAGQRVIDAGTTSPIDTAVPIALDVPAVIDNILQVLAADYYRGGGARQFASQNESTSNDLPS